MYVSAGTRTIFVLDGATKYARLMNEVPASPMERVHRANYEAWKARHPDLAPLAEDIQYKTFDRVNAL